LFIERTGVVFRGCLKKCQDRSLRRLKRLSWLLLRRESTIYGIRRKQDPKKQRALELPHSTEVSSKSHNGRYMYTYTPSYEDRCSTVTALRYITRKSCIKNTSIVPFPNLASMLLSVQTVKSNRGIPSVAWINDDK